MVGSEVSIKKVVVNGHVSLSYTVVAPIRSDTRRQGQPRAAVRGRARMWSTKSRILMSGSRDARVDREGCR
jgi:hypothetical protein